MSNYNTEINIFKKEKVFFLILYFSLIVSLLFGEDSTGGAVVDFNKNSMIINEFINDFKFALLNYDNLPHTTRHSPVLLSIIALLYKLNFSEIFVKLFYLHLNLLLPLFFYKCLKIKFNNIDNNKLFIFSLIIFLSPTFRTLSIWLDSRILGVTIFTISIYYFLKFLNKNKFKYVYLNIFFYALASYISPNFSLFSIFFLNNYLSKFNFFSKKFAIIALINFFLAIPAIYYVFGLEIYFFFAKATVDLPGKDIFFYNIFNQVLIIPTILFFYIFPFLFINSLKLTNSAYYVITSIILTSISIYYFNYQISFTGGGIFFHLSDFIFENNYLFYLISLVSIFVILNLFFINKENSLLFLIIFFGNPQTTIYHKYYDPLIVIILLILMNIKIDTKKLFANKSLYLIFMYYLAFLIISNVKYLLR